MSILNRLNRFIKQQKVKARKRFIARQGFLAQQGLGAKKNLPRGVANPAGTKLANRCLHDTRRGVDGTMRL